MKPNKFIGYASALLSLFSSSALALIIEGSFSGTMGQFINENMDVTPDAKFWYENENEYQPFTGTFWYDTEIGGSGISPWDPDVVMFIQERDWVHTTLIGANGASVEITSRGNLPSYSKHPTDSIYLERYDNGNTFFETLTMFYSDYKPSTQHGVTGPHRDGALRVASLTPILDGFSLNQTFELSSENNGNEPIGSVYLKTKGVLDGTSYESEFWGQVNKFEIHVRDSASVAEPSSLLLFLGPLVFILCRHGFFPIRLRSFFKIEDYKTAT